MATLVKGWVNFLAALSSSRSLVVGRLVRRLVRHVCEKVTFRVSKGNSVVTVVTVATVATVVTVVTVVTVMTVMTVVTVLALLKKLCD